MSRIAKIISLLAIAPVALASASYYAVKTFEPVPGVIIETIETSDIPETIVVTPIESTVIVTPSATPQPTATPTPTAAPTATPTVQETTAATAAATTKAPATTTKATVAATTKAPAVTTKATTAATTAAPPVETSPPVATTAAYTPNCDNIKSLIVSNLQSRGYWFPDAASIGGGSMSLTTNYFYSDDKFAAAYLTKFTDMDKLGIGVISVSVWIENGYVNFSYDKCRYPTT